VRYFFQSTLQKLDGDSCSLYVPQYALFVESVTAETDMEETKETSDLGIVWGAESIGKVINRTPRQAYHLLATGAIQAARQVGGLWCADRGGLRRQFCGRQGASDD
jgi:hypothetical protein